LHIENKLATGAFTPNQPEMYPLRAQLWVNKQKYKNYKDWDTVLVAPSSLTQKFAADAAKFCAVITHEEIADHVEAFRYE
jgi:hypothetical protein